MHCHKRFDRFWSRCLRGSPQLPRVPVKSIQTNGGSGFNDAFLAEHGYWEERYSQSNGGHFDWLTSSGCTLDNVLPYLRPGAKVLDLGCGTSQFALELCRARPCAQVYCLDYSRAALALMKHLCEEQFGKHGEKKPSLNFVHGNATKMPFKTDMFDVVIDKGTTDSVLKFEDRTRAYLMARKIQNEALRITSRSGVYIQITDEDPELRLDLLRDNTIQDSLDKSSDFSVSYRQISDEEHWQHFMYVLSFNDP